MSTSGASALNAARLAWSNDATSTWSARSCSSIRPASASARSGRSASGIGLEARQARPRVGLDLDVHEGVGGDPDHLFEGGDREVLGGEAGRRRDRAGGDPAVHVGVVGPAVLRPLPGDVAVGGVERLQLLERVIDHAASPVGRAVDGRVVHRHHVPVAGDEDVELEHVGAAAQRRLVGVHGLRGGLVGPALVRDVRDAVFGEPGVGGRGRALGGVHRRRRGAEQPQHECGHHPPLPAPPRSGSPHLGFASPATGWPVARP